MMRSKGRLMLHRRGHPTPTRCFRGLEPPPRCSFFPLAWLPLLGFPVGIRLSFRPSVPASPLPPAPSQLHVLQAARTPPLRAGCGLLSVRLLKHVGQGLTEA